MTEQPCLHGWTAVSPWQNSRVSMTEQLCLYDQNSLCLCDRTAVSSWQNSCVSMAEQLWVHGRRAVSPWQKNCVSMAEQLSEVVRKLVYWVFDSAFWGYLLLGVFQPPSNPYCSFYDLNVVTLTPGSWYADLDPVVFRTLSVFIPRWRIMLLINRSVKDSSAAFTARKTRLMAPLWHSKKYR